MINEITSTMELSSHVRVCSNKLNNVPIVTDNSNILGNCALCISSKLNNFTKFKVNSVTISLRFKESYTYPFAPKNFIHMETILQTFFLIKRFLPLAPGPYHSGLNACFASQTTISEVTKLSLLSTQKSSVRQKFSFIGKQYSRGRFQKALDCSRAAIKIVSLSR